MSQNIEFNLQYVGEWIQKHGLTSLCLHFHPNFYHRSTWMVMELKRMMPQVHFLVMISCSSGIDTLQYRVNGRSLQHESQYTPDGVIYFGVQCTCYGNYSKQIPTLFLSTICGKY